MRRREFITLIGSALPISSMITALPSTSALAAGAVSVSAGRTVKFHDSTIVPALGQGSARLGQGRHPEAAEEEALRTGLSLGMTLIDTAEKYGNGHSERIDRPCHCRSARTSIPGLQGLAQSCGGKRY